MRTNAWSLGALVLALAVLPAAAAGSGYDTIAGHYEAIRVALLNDTTEGVAGHAKDLEAAARKLVENFDAARAGVKPDKQAECIETLPELATAAARVAGAGSLDDARDAFFELTRSLVRYRQMTERPESIVVFCSMAKKAWIQPAGEIGNPYYGQSMARCGQIVSD